jgi:hypothetical protein
LFLKDLVPDVFRIFQNDRHELSAFVLGGRIAAAAVALFGGWLPAATQYIRRVSAEEQAQYQHDDAADAAANG